MQKPFLIILLLFLYGHLAAQTDSIVVVKKKQNIFQTAMRLVSKKHPDTASSPVKPALVIKAEVPYLPYKGKIIRHILIKKFGFEKNFTDTTKRSGYFGTRILNTIHRDTRPWQVRNNLFIQENMPLNTYVLAENERYLRALDYIQDARIIVQEVPGSSDSIDLLVVTKDLFSINGSLSSFSMDRVRAKVAEENLLGTGQKVQITGLYERKRDPKFATAILYNINNINHSFVNATITLSQINNNITNGRRDEHSFLVQLDRPLPSAYARFAGSLTVGANQTNNNYLEPDSFFYEYKYNIFDAWVGYNLGVKKLLADNNMRDRKFVSIRYFTNKFQEQPFQIGEHFNQRYNDKHGILTQFTFFRQDFYKTNYIYGFGTTEDVPTGYNVAVTAGWYKQSYLSRPYAGIDANLYRFSDKGHFIQYFLRAGGFMNNRRIQDAGLLIGTSVFSRLYIFSNFKMRQYMRLSFTRQFNRLTFDELRINNPFGIRYFGSDSVLGARRISLHGETFTFLKYKAFGFQFSPFVFQDVSLVTPENQSISKTQFYWGIGGGLRTRNENLVFGTMEFRFVYFPRKEAYSNTFKVTGTINLRFRYNSSYVRAPDIIQLNTDNSNSVF